MSCEVVTVDGVFGGSPMFVCSEDVRPSCAICHQGHAPFLCDWPVERKVHVPAFSVEVGDVWITQQAGKRGSVVVIEYLDIHGRPWATKADSIERRFWVAIPGHKDHYPYIRFEIDSVETLRPGTCDAPCCDAHVREVAEERHYCADHWRAWEQVA
jgi:hypothetical protein